MSEDPFGSMTAEEAWHEGYETATREADEVFEDKDAFIAKQERLITELMKVVSLHDAWGSVPDEVREALRDYA